MTAPPARPLILTRDPVLLDDLVRLCAAAGTEPAVAGHVDAARSLWTGASLVLVGLDAAPTLREASGAPGRDNPAGPAWTGLPRRGRVVLVLPSGGGSGGDDGTPGPEVWRQAVTVGAEQVAVLPDAEPWLVELLAEPAPRAVPAPIVAVLGGRGGAGATTLACALALAARRSGVRALLVDADPLGGGIDLALGAEDAPGLRWPDLADAEGRIPPADLVEALPQVRPDPAALHVLSWDRGDLTTVPAAALDALLVSASDAADLVVVDLPRSFDEAALAVLDRATMTLLLVPTEVRACAAAARVATAAAGRCRDLRLVTRGPAPGGLSADDVTRALGLPLAGDLRPEPGLAAALERGEPGGSRSRGPLARFCQGLLDDLLPGGAERRAA